MKRLRASVQGYVASDLPNGGFTMDDCTIEKDTETDPESQYHALLAGASSLEEALVRPGVTPVRLTHLRELREALSAAYFAAARAVPRWTDSIAASGSTPIKAAHLMELRAAVMALE